MNILAIDTSCDDTSIAISQDLNIIANVSWTKMKVHSDWGGVVPSEAKRQHIEFLEPAINEALKLSNLKIENIDYFAVTQGPGLAIALESGVDKAKELSLKYNKPLVPINHMVGHIYASLAKDENGKSLSDVNDFEFPLLAFAISGGHTSFYKMDSHLDITEIGYTLDDAVGEAFDKVGRMLGMGFPAGVYIEQAALKGNPDKYDFPKPMLHTKDFNFSFSGLKTAVLYAIRKIIGDYDKNAGKGVFKLEDASKLLTQEQINDIAASFQKAAIETIINKTRKAIIEYNPKVLVVGGGVIANMALRKALINLTDELGIKLSYPKPMWLCTDNASMVAIASYYYIKKGIVKTNAKEIEEIDRIPNKSNL